MIAGAVLCLGGGIFWSIRNISSSKHAPTASATTEEHAGASAQAQKETVPRLSPGIARITDPGVHWEERVQAVRDLPSRLGEESVSQLFAFLEQPPASGEEKWYLVCNEIMEVLRKRNMVPGIYTKSLTKLVTSPSADPMIRDYAVQHLAQWASGIDPAACEPDQALAVSAFASMHAEAGNSKNGALTMVGTACNALADAVINGSPAIQAKRDEVSRLALAVIRDSAFSTVNRSSAIQAAARLGADGLPAICRELAADTHASVDLRLSSIAALGVVGGPEDLSFIRTFQNQDAYKFAAATALERLEGASN